MTESAESIRCGWCGREIAPLAGPGRPRRYCRHACRQRAYELRRRRREGQLRPGEVPISAGEFETLRDGLYELSAAMDDVDADLADDGDYKAAFTHLYRAARSLRGLELFGASGA